jgi:hypothetical protein
MKTFYPTVKEVIQELKALKLDDARIVSWGSIITQIGSERRLSWKPMIDSGASTLGELGRKGK